MKAQDISATDIVLLLSIVLGSAVKIVNRKATNRTRCKRYGRAFQEYRRSCSLSEAVVWTALMLTSNEHSVMLGTMTNGDLWDFLRKALFSAVKNRLPPIPFYDTPRTAPCNKAEVPFHRRHAARGVCEQRMTALRKYL